MQTCILSYRDAHTSENIHKCVHRYTFEPFLSEFTNLHKHHIQTHTNKPIQAYTHPFVHAHKCTNTQENPNMHAHILSYINAHLHEGTHRASTHMHRIQNLCVHIHTVPAHTGQKQHECAHKYHMHSYTKHRKATTCMQTVPQHSTQHR